MIQKKKTKVTPYHLHIILLLLTSLIPALSDFGDTSDPYFPVCPAYATCPPVCVSSYDLCPESLLCDEGETLCIDGTCIDEGEECPTESISNPCSEHICAPFACRRFDDDISQCSEIYGDYYDAAASCENNEAALFTFKEVGFLFYYIWMSVVTLSTLIWCAYNQRLSPVEGSTRPLTEAATTTDDYGSGYEKEGVGWTQTAYKSHPVGNFIYVMICITLIGYQVLLTTLVVLYYITMGNISFWEPVFNDEEQILLAFIIVWMVGLFWYLALRWPYDIRSICLRRCSFDDDPTHVAVFAPIKGSDDENNDRESALKDYWAERYASKVRGAMDAIMGFIYSDVNRLEGCQGRVEFRPVCKGDDGLRYFYYGLRRYPFDEMKGMFHPSEGSIIAGGGMSMSDMEKFQDGLSDVEAQKRLRAIGPNSIDIEKPSFLKDIIWEFSGVFYIYQCFMIWSWMPLEYYYMAIVFAVVVLVGGLNVAYFKYRNEVSLYQLTNVFGHVFVKRPGCHLLDEIDIRELVPGDVVKLTTGIVHADIIILGCGSGSIAVDESALTGESAPVSKIDIGNCLEDNVMYDPVVHKRSSIYAGTTILECSEIENDWGLVISTGSFTRKGEMLREILGYERHRFKFDSEVEIVVSLLFFLGIIAFFITGFVLIKEGWVWGWFYGIYVFASCLPALLPTVFVVSVGISTNRLSRKNITCINSEAILIAGKIRVALFDKTGTLTKQGLDFLSAINAKQMGRKSDPIDSIANLNVGMTCCHTLSPSGNGDLIGNSVDMIMFKSTGATMMITMTEKEQRTDKNAVVVKSTDGSSITILKRFDFDHHRMTQSVIARTNDGIIVCYVKGSAESIASLCREETIPPGFQNVRKSASDGVYQISMASKIIDVTMDIESLRRDDIERDLSYLGVVNFRNAMRTITPQVLKELEEGDVRCIMVTGDDIRTAIHIGKESGMIAPDKTIIIGVGINENDGTIIWHNEKLGVPERLPPLGKTLNEDYELAILGEIWRSILTSRRDYALDILPFIRVFGRCTPNDKISVVASFSNLGYITLMCGDGGNDCGALKTAHVGIALSDAEASMVSPFTSIDKCISSVPEVLKEGRCALASAIASYKYMIMYGMVQTINQMANAYFQTTFCENCWVFMDGVWLISMAFTLPLARAAHKLAKETPTASILGAHTMFSACGVLAINVTFMIISLVLLTQQDWYQCRKWNRTDVSNANEISDNYEAEVLFLVTGYQYVSSAMAYNFGYNFRAAWIQNHYFVVLVFIFTFIHFYIILNPSKLSCFFRVNCVNENVVGSTTKWFTLMPIQNDFHHTLLEEDFRTTILIIVVVNTLAICGYEYFIVNGIGKKMAASWKNKPKPTYTDENFEEATVYLIHDDDDRPIV